MGDVSSLEAIEILTMNLSPEGHHLPVYSLLDQKSVKPEPYF